MGYTQSMVGFWDLSNVNPPDICWRGLGNHGTGVNTPVVVDGIAGGKALEFDGDDAYVNLGDLTYLNAVSAFTIAFWMNQDVLDVADTLLFKYSTGLRNIAIQTLASGQFRFSIENNSTSYGQFDYSTVISAGVWHQVVVVFDGSGAANADRLKVYVDDSLVTLAFTGSIPATTYNLAGVDVVLGNATFSFDGKLDEFMIFDAVLTQMNAADLHARTRRGTI
ncbi:hypothetical protein LCGC14_1152170 [marine sediment metagenome]|uniref:LamG-like jellyroll fold domain-containing protein n=1 Tax=marine sediment metagenome TaxID=412755 RepID=A0A0F9LV28_9ZZZZ